MSSIRASRYHDICAGHRVHGHESKCAHLHGHNYRFHFHCEAIPAKPKSRELGVFRTEASGLDSIGRVIDFSVIKSALCEWIEENFDHRFLIWRNDPLADQLHEMDPKGTVIVPFNPTAENLAKFMVEVVAPDRLKGTGVMLVECVVEETAKCSASFHL